MTYPELIQFLRDRNLESLIDQINAERAKAQDSASTPTAKRSAVVAVESYFAETLTALLENRPARITLNNIKLKLVEAITAVLKPKISPIDVALKKGKKLKVDFDDGIFTARLDEIVVDGETVEKALANLASKISEPSKESVPEKEILELLGDLS